MCDTRDSDSVPEESPSRSARVISLCAHRRARDIEDATSCLVPLLEHIHCRAIEVHNRIITRAQVSVLTELCRTAGLFLDLIDEELQAAVVTPAALYGDSGGKIFGKRPLQQRIAEFIDDEEAAAIVERLNAAHSAVFEYQLCQGEPTNRAVPLAGPNAGNPLEVAALVVRDGEVARREGVYTGWPLVFRDEQYVVFGHRLDRQQEVAVRDLLARRSDRNESEVWRRLELPLLRAVIDPEKRHRTSEVAEGYAAIRRPTSRSGHLLAIRRALWRHFSEPCDGVTLHAHIAALIDDAAGQQAFIEEVEEIIDMVTLKCGGLPEGQPPVTTAEVLAPFYVDHRGHLLRNSNLRSHPLALLLLDDDLLQMIGIAGDRPIDEAIRWAAANGDHNLAHTIDMAWMTYRTEQNLMGTYGWHPVDGYREREETRDFPSAKSSSVLPNLRVLFDRRFMSHTIFELNLDSSVRSRLKRALVEEGCDPDEFTLGQMGRDERELSRMHGISRCTCNAVRHALLELGTHWRWRRCGLDPRAYLLSEGPSGGLGDIGRNS